MQGRDVTSRAQQLTQIEGNDASLVDVDWAFGGVTDDELRFLAVALRGNQHVRTIDLNYNQSITDRGIQALASVVQSCVLTKVAADGTPHVTQGARNRLIRPLLSNALTSVHANDPATTVIDVSEMALRDTHISLLAKALRGNRYVKFLGLWKNSITGAGVSQLLPALRLSAVSAVSIDNCPASVDEAARLALEDICVHRTLELLRTNATELDEINTVHIWHLNYFGDCAAQALANALAENKVLQRIWVTDTELPGGSRSFTDTGAAHLGRVLSNGICGVVCVNLDFNTADALPVRSIRQLGRACFENALRRVAENDPTLLRLDLRFGQDVVGSRASSSIIGVRGMRRLAKALRRNTELRSLHVGDSTTEAIDVLLDVLPYCGVEEAVYDSYCDAVRSKERLAELLAANRSRRLAAEASLAVHRPFQRLALCAMFTSMMCGVDRAEPQVLLPDDLLDVIADKLNRSKISPFTHANYQQLPKHETLFAWHDVSSARDGRKRRRIADSHSSFRA